TVRAARPGSRWSEWGSPRRPDHKHSWRSVSTRGPHKDGGTGPKRRTEGVPCAVATWATPVSPHTSNLAWATNRTSRSMSVRPARTETFTDPAAHATCSAVARSSAEPVRRTLNPRSPRYRTTRANRRRGHCREADAAPGCTITVCSETSVGPGQGQRRSSGSVDTPYHSNKAHHSLASWTGPGHGALVVDAGPPHSWAQSSSGARARRASVLCGP